MADVNKPKLQLRSGLSFNGDKTTKLLINHGKPNFTISRSPKMQNGNDNPISPPMTSDEFVVKSTLFNGVFKPSNISVATKQTLQQNGNDDSEASKVVLRRAKVVETELREGENENVPEFILRQRRIQERLANQNILDFESRRSGYFTHVVISPTNPSRQSFVETMASPAVMPGLEIPPPVSPQQEKIDEEKLSVQHEAEQKLEEKIEEIQQELQQNEVKSEENVHAVPVTVNGQDEEEEVAKAIEEVNKAVEGEDEDSQETEQTIQPTVVAVEETKPEEVKKSIEETPVVAAFVASAVEVETPAEEAHTVATVVTSAVDVETPTKEAHIVADVELHTPVEEIHTVAAVVTSAPVAEEEQPVVTSSPLIEEHVEDTKTNGIVEETLQNGHTNCDSNGHASDNDITISHTNGLNGPIIPSPDPSGEKGVNFEPKTVVSFSQELGSEINKYPDTVKVIKDAETSEADKELKELTKLKFEITTDDKDIEVKHVLVTETA